MYDYHLCGVCKCMCEGLGGPVVGLRVPCYDCLPSDEGCSYVRHPFFVSAVSLPPSSVSLVIVSKTSREVKAASV